MARKILKILFITGISLYLVLCAAFYLFQEKLLFSPVVHQADHQVDIGQPAEERYLTMEDGTRLNGLLIKADSSKGLVFYLHGNGGSLWERTDQAETFTDAGFDFFMLDYRGYGKSEGVITNEATLYADVTEAFDQVAAGYSGKPVIIYGYSLGTGFAIRTAAERNADMLVLLAPFYSMINVKNVHYPVFPSFLMKYKLRSYEFYSDVDCPTIIFHGLDDTLIPPDNSRELSELNPHDTLILLDDQAHNYIPYRDEFRTIMHENLAKLK